MRSPENITRPAPAFAATLAFGLSALLGCSSCHPFFDRQLSAAVLALDGKADQTLAGEKLRLTKSSWVHPGAKISTAPDSRLDLLVLPGVLVSLAGNTEIEIEHLRLQRNGDETIRPMVAREATLHLLRGTLTGAVGQAQARSKLVIHTAAGTLTAFDLRTFKVAVDENRIRIMSARSKTIFVPVGGFEPVKIGAGYFAAWPASPAVPQPALSDPQAQAELAEILATERRLFREQEEHGLVFVPWRP